MSNFLDLCNRVVQEAGTEDATISTVTGRTGRLASVVTWTAKAWELIQLSRAGWLFLRAELPSTALTTANTLRYTAASWNISSFGAWITEKRNITIYAQSTGVSDETEIVFIPWATFRTLYLRGTQTSNRPIHWSVSPAGEFCFGPIPDATYRVNGEFRRGVQTLAADADTPICPADYHEIIVWRAVQLLIENDEAEANLLNTVNRKFNQYLEALVRDQMPEITANAPPLA